jgi:hypothetical protein
LPASRYRVFARCGGGFLAAGCEAGLLRLVRGMIDSAFQMAPPWQTTSAVGDAPLLVAMPVDLRQTIVVQPVGLPAMTGVRRFTPSNALPVSWIAGGVPGINERTCGAAYSTDGSLYSLQFDGNEHLELKVSGYSQQLLQTSRLRLDNVDPFDGALHLPLPMAMHGRTVFAALADRLFYFKPNAEPFVYALRGEASSMALLPSSRSSPAVRLFIAHAEGCTALTFDGAGNIKEQTFAGDLPDAKLAAISGGRIVVATPHLLEVYRITARGMEFGGRLEVNFDSIVGVVPTSDRGFAILTELGSGYRYRE